MNDTASTKPVKIGSAAFAALSYKMRQWSGWAHGTLVLGDTKTDSPYASCSHDPEYTIRVNPEHLLLNPNRVLKTVTPFRLRQEALLTGALLHEAGHARHSHWQPGRYGNPLKAVHGDDFTTSHPLTGEPVVLPVSDLVLDFAKTIEEARIEGLVAAQATEIGAHGLAWTMRCSAIHVLPFTDVSTDPAQAAMDVLTSWVLRAGRQVATAHQVTAAGRTYQMPSWINDFNVLLRKVVGAHIVDNKTADQDTESLDPWADFEVHEADPEYTNVITLLYDALTKGDEASEPGSTYMVDQSKRILDILFPADQQQGLDAGEACQEDAGQDDGEPGENDDQDSGEGEGQPGDSDAQEGSQGSQPAKSDDQAMLQSDLTDIEEAAAKQSDAEKAAEIAEPSEGPDPTQPAPESGEDDTPPEPNKPPQRGAGDWRGESNRAVHYRQPKATEREVKKQAETFLRNTINPSEGNQLQISDSPTASVDGAALAAFKAGGQTTAPLFFRRIKRTARPAPPVRIAILVDVSASMDVLQKPSALLSWALSAACLDLRNFAGRGVQVESTLIHWGSSARVIQRNGEAMPGIHEDDCHEMTAALPDALDLVASELPGFFDHSAQPENRLLVQFTDWQLGRGSVPGSQVRIHRALEVGVNMLSVVPQDYSYRSTSLEPIIASARDPKGKSLLMRYNPNKPGEVWTAASEVLAGAAH